MSYQATGDTTRTLADAAKVGTDILRDPFLSEVLCQARRLSALEQLKNPGPPCPKTPKQPLSAGGAGLRYAVVPLRIAVKVREQPLLAPLAVGALISTIFAFGYLTGTGGR